MRKTSDESLIHFIVCFSRPHNLHDDFDISSSAFSGALLLVRPEAGYIKNRLLLHTVAGSVGRPGLHSGPAPAEL